MAQYRVTDLHVRTSTGFSWKYTMMQNCSFT